MRPRTTVRAALAVAGTLAATASCLTATAVPASAGPKNCAAEHAHSKLIGHTTHLRVLYGPNKGDIYGGAEWRYGTSGRCKGYKWVELYVTRAFNTAPHNSLQVNLFADSGDASALKYWKVDRVTVGTWHSYAMYGYHRSLTAVGGANTASGMDLGIGQFHD